MPDHPQIDYRKLDALIAQKVMGWTLYHYSKGPNPYYLLLESDGTPVDPFDRGQATEEEAWDTCPSFSTNMDAAWQVVEHLLQSSHTVPFIDAINDSLGGIKTFGTYGAYRVVYDVVRWLSPVNICFAALAAIGMSRKEVLELVAA